MGHQASVTPKEAVSQKPHAEQELQERAGLGSKILGSAGTQWSCAPGGDRERRGRGLRGRKRRGVPQKGHGKPVTDATKKGQGAPQPGRRDHRGSGREYGKNTEFGNGRSERGQ